MPTPLLFPDAADAPAAVPTLFAEIVFDRPLDHAYTYAVPDELAHAIGIGKRVECSFGKGSRTTAGYCIGITAQAPHYATKPILRVLDDVALLDEPLLKLTRWMADYYLCGWGQVLQCGGAGRGARERRHPATPCSWKRCPAEQLPNRGTHRQPAAEDWCSTFVEASKPGPSSRVRICQGVAKCGPGVVSGLVSQGAGAQSSKERDRIAFLQALSTEPVDEARFAARSR